MPTDRHEACEWYEVGQAAAWEDATRWLRELSGKAFVAQRDEIAQELRTHAFYADARAKEARVRQKAKREKPDAD